MSTLCLTDTVDEVNSLSMELTGRHNALTKARVQIKCDSASIKQEHGLVDSAFTMRVH